jgi:hypothetical protein
VIKKQKRKEIKGRKTDKGGEGEVCDVNLDTKTD